MFTHSWTINLVIKQPLVKRIIGKKMRIILKLGKSVTLQFWDKYYLTYTTLKKGLSYFIFFVNRLLKKYIYLHLS